MNAAAARFTKPRGKPRAPPQPRPPAQSLVSEGALVDAARRNAMICEAAYYYAESRGFEPGHELDDWLAAQEQIDAALALGQSPTLRGNAR